MQTAGVKAVLTKRLGSCDVLDERGLFRCHRRASQTDAPYAVFYVDCTGQVPQAKGELLAYEERIIAKDFYRGPKHLRWNHYLIFAVPEATWKVLEVKGQKHELESDTAYARKFLVKDADLEAFLQQTDHLVPSESSAPKDPTEAWKKSLSASGLDKVVYAPTRSTAVAKWLSTPAKPSAAEVYPADKDLSPQQEDAKRIRRLSWNNFRPYPEVAEFDFLDVNLISGVNGVGKTSLLEAIESFYCGSTLRNRSDATTEVSAVLEGGVRSLRLSHTAEARRRRELRWFGHYWRGKDELNDKFNKFLFFNSDSAYRLEHSENSGQFVGSALANVALGTEATELWGKIEEFHAVFLDEKQRLMRQRREADGKIRVLDQQLKRLEGQPLVSSKHLDSLRQALREAAWKVMPNTLEDFEASFVSRITAVTSRFTSLTRLIRQPIEARGSRSASQSWRERLDNATATVKQMAQSALKVTRLTASLEERQARHKKAMRLQKYTKSWLKAYCSLQVHEARSNALTDNLDVLDGTDLAALPNQYLDYALSPALSHSQQALAEHRRALTQAKRALSTLKQSHDALRSITIQIQSLGREVVSLAPDLEDCPLCGTKHPKGRLTQILHQAVAALDTTNSKVSEATKRLSLLERDVDASGKTAACLNALQAFCMSVNEEAADLGKRNVASLVKQVDAARLSKQEADAEATRAIAVIDNLAGSGLSEDEFLELWHECISENAIDDYSDIDGLVTKIGHAEVRAARNVSDLKAQLDQQRDQSKSLTDTAWSTLSQFKSRATSLEEALGDLAEYVQEVESFSSALDKHADLLGPPTSTNSADFIKRQELVKRVAADLLQAVSLERTQRLEQQGLSKQLSSLNESVAHCAARLQRAEQAIDSLGDLKNKHGRDALLKQFIEDNRTKISEILRVIHAPREFKGIGDLEPNSEHGLSLVRENGRLVGLSRISTGQRCAVALAVFFTLNMQLRIAPPIIMMDDPVAHVDDLNVLALLDYLREVALSGRRQVFFATANEKLGGIFEQKFASMPERFKKLALTRSRA